ncbi:hypothetical protein SAMN05444486_10639 [Lentibacter algarum]|jgi:hypothetical protein|uniref:Uncharacterized protein n=1 Tax=Lentibacter algarum TaxID=576131 RepID=A0A1H3NBT3_9RHOB|nr:hypothetical protein SAMN05444486_10639 [Lentibacter algarum]
MSKKRLTAQPIREGIATDSGFPIVVWRDYRWNNNQISRTWFVELTSIDEAEVEIRPLDGAKQTPEGSLSVVI